MSYSLNPLKTNEIVESSTFITVKTVTVSGN